MKKKIIFVLAIFAFMLITIPSVFASTTITQTDFDDALADIGNSYNGVTYHNVGGYKWYSLTADEEFVFGGDIDLDDAFLDSDNNTINLNGHSITTSGETVLNGYDKNLTLAGTGTIEKGVIVGGATLTLNGNITYNGTVTISDGTGLGTAVVNAGTFNAGFEGANSTLTINGGTFIGAGWGGALNLNGNVTTTINGGTFSATAASAAYITASTVTITDGTFTSTGDNGIETFDDSTDLTISGGTFTGLASGLTADGNPTIKLSGGTFKATGTDDLHGAIRTDNTFASLLVSGYKYSVDSTTTAGVYSAKETSVVSESTITTTTDADTTDDTTTSNNPQTGDNLKLYISMLVLTVIGFVVAGFYTGKRVFNK